MNGIINVIKPPTMSSNGVTVYLRKLLNVKKIGHAGTLDPQAAGILVCLLGRSTRISDHLMAERKRYIAEITFGVETDTLDTEGTVLRRDSIKIGEGDLKRACEAFTGTMEQTPPKYSAIKVGGRKAYELARDGREVELKKRIVTIYSIDVISCTGNNRYLLDICCEKGTYIRTLLKDMGEYLGTCAATSLLIRAASGHFDLDSAYTLDEIRDMTEKGDLSFLTSPYDAMRDLDTVTVSISDGEKLKNGVELACDPKAEGMLRICAEDVFLGLGRAENGRIKLKVSLY